MTEIGGGNITPKTVDVAEIHGDLRPSVIQITVDRLTLVLERHVHKIERSRDWIAPLGVFLSIVLTCVTATFHDAVGLKAETWSAIFVLLGALSLLWLIFTVVQRKRADTVDELVGRLKSNEKP